MNLRHGNYGQRLVVFTYSQIKNQCFKFQLISSKRVSPDQLATFKTEIRQYEKYLMKVSHHKKVLDDSYKMSRSNSKDKPDEFHDDYHIELSAEQEMLERKTKKYETYIVDKINEMVLRGHEEL